jgi:hypothetical protein
MNYLVLYFWCVLCRWVTKFPGNITNPVFGVAFTSTLKMGHHIPLKRWYPLTSLHGITAQKTTVSTFTSPGFCFYFSIRFYVAK